MTLLRIWIEHSANCNIINRLAHYFRKQRTGDRIQMVGLHEAGRATPWRGEVPPQRDEDGCQPFPAIKMQKVGAVADPSIIVR